MSKKVFNYSGFSKIEIEGPKNLLERIAENVEGEISSPSDPNCRIKINQSKNLVEIEKDKRYSYLTIDKIGAREQSSIKYTRYNTHVRTIHQKSNENYEVDVNVELDEASGLICVRNHLSNHSKLSQYPILHASFLNLDGKGILIPGNSKHGKTTLAVYLLQEQKANFVSDENVILDINDEKFRGFYVPRTPRVRFSTIAESGLSKVLEDITIANATQYIDSDAIERIISTRSFNVDAGLAFSRQSFCNLFGTNSQESSPIDLVLFPRYMEGKSAYVRILGLEEGVERLSRTGLKRKSDIDPKELEETIIDINLSKFREFKFIEVGFSDIESLKRGGFRL